MKLNYITKFYGPDVTGLAVGATAAGLQAALGLVQAIGGGAKTKKLLAQRKAYKTPEEIFKILQATESIQGGYDPSTLAYLTGQSDRAFGSSLSAATLLGADPNQLSAIFDQRMQATMKIGAENHLQNMINFDKYISALGLVSDNLAAEQKSQQDIIKDKLQSASADKQAGLQNIAGGVNTALATATAAGTMDLYKEQQNQKKQLDDLLKLIQGLGGAPVNSVNSSGGNNWSWDQ